ncbi:hypothetical protein PR048_032001 [Dryococelus australis]|uniref:Uncharacterized protein n=1 Tax=Dryococelus australis TaxID=614101 RepID=A0ABQ9G6W9_9NEOP|nr:hypothetical protein PR048_032001 [Dryococelus australis]
MRDRRTYAQVLAKVDKHASCSLREYKIGSVTLVGGRRYYSYRELGHISRNYKNKVKRKKCSRENHRMEACHTHVCYCKKISHTEPQCFRRKNLIETGPQQQPLAGKALN